MKIIDLSVSLENGMMYYPGDPVPEISPALTLEKDGCRVTELHIGSHTGTHMDAPAHFIKDGKTIEQLELSRCMGRAVILELTDLAPCHRIVPEDIQEYLPLLKHAQIVLFHTEWTAKYGREEFYKHPYLSKELAELLISCGIYAVGVDMLNVDCTCLEGDLYTEASTEAHQVLLGNEVVIVENLTNLSAVDFEDPYVMFVPLKISGADGSPVRAVAFPADENE